MVELTLLDVCEATQTAAPEFAATTVLSGVSTDTRTLRAEQLFIALRGPHFDGHDFLRQAAEKGAAAAIVRQGLVPPPSLPARFVLIPVPDPLIALGSLARYHRSRFALPLIAVTGSVGKTTTRAMIEHILASRFPTLGSPESWNNEIGVPLTLLRLGSHHQAAVLELAMRGPGEIRYLTDCARPTIGLITNIGESHLERLGSIEAIAEAKAELFEGLPEQGTALLNRDDPWHDRLASHAHCARLSFGLTGPADYQAGTVSQELGGIRFRVLHEDDSSEVFLALPGRHNATNALAAVAAAGVAGVPLDEAVAALRSFSAQSHRSMLLQLPGNITILDDCYNASPASVRAALDTLAAFPAERRRILVFGDMKEIGPTTRQAHREVGQQAMEAGVEVIITVGAQAQQAAREAERSRPGSVQTVYCDTPIQALSALRECLRPGDVALIKASRAMHLEGVVEGLMQSGTQ